MRGADDGNDDAVMSDISDEDDDRSRHVVIDVAGEVDDDHYAMTPSHAEAAAADNDVDDGADMIGPLPVGHRHAAKSEAHLELEKRALELKLAKFTDMETNEELVVRDEWMLELPEVRGVVTDMGLTARQFRKKERAEIGDRSGWTETPSDRDRKRRTHGQPSQPSEEEVRAAQKAEARQVYNERRDREQEEMARKHKKRTKRDESLLDQHQKKLKKEKRVSAARPVVVVDTVPLMCVRLPFVETRRGGGSCRRATIATSVQPRRGPEGEPIRSGAEKCYPEESAAARHAFRPRRDQVSVIASRSCKRSIYIYVSM